MAYSIPDVGLVKQVIHTAYGMSFAKAYALCRDAGMDKADAESCLHSLAKNIHEDVPISMDSIRAHLILERATRERGEREGAVVQPKSGAGHQHDAWQIRESDTGPYCAACGASL